MYLHYILDDDGNPVIEPDLLKWARWFETADRVLAKDRDEGGLSEGVLVSTVFLGLDHNFLGSGPPVLWETMVFDGPLDGEQERYTSKEDALRGHQDMCRRMNKAREGKA